MLRVEHDQQVREALLVTVHEEQVKKTYRE